MAAICRPPQHPDRDMDCSYDDSAFFPFGRKLSFHKLIDAWREIATSASSETQRNLAADIIRRAEAIPELSEGVESASQVAEYSGLIEELMSIVVPVFRSKDWLIGGMIPFKMDAFYATPGFGAMVAAKETAMASGNIDGWESVEELERSKRMNAHHIILNELYGVETSYNFPSLLSSIGPDGMASYYRFQVDPEFIEIVVNGDKPELSDEQIKQLTRDPLNAELWTELLPPAKFEFKGFTVISLIDVTEHEVQGQLKNDLLQKNAVTTPERVSSIEKHLRSLLGIADLRIGIIGLTSGRFEDIERSQTFGRSLLIDSKGIPDCPMRNNSSYAKLFETGKTVIIDDLEECSYCTGFEHRIKSQGFRNLMLVPLKDGDQLAGVLELATLIPGELDAFSASKLDSVVSLFSAAMVRSIDERSDRIQALIKKEFTSIHPAVEWRFKKAAENLDLLASRGEKGEADEIVFEDVYPLYGLSDIRDSTVKRNGAIQEDLVEQLNLALSVIVEASSKRPLPALDELGFRLDRYAQMIEDGLTSDIEIGALEFLRKDVEPLFNRLAGDSPSIAAKVQEYNDSLDSRLGVLYNRRRGYEEAVGAVNKTVSSFLAKKQVEAQSMYPHYFEKYETDGVDYNIYVGGSIAEGQPFDELFLHNLRLWQLQTMCGIVWELKKTTGDLEVPLELAHLILIQDFPIAIRFSKDEKQFGVDGAYNARYMIVKKRIDKANIKGSTDRVTQPGKIAIVYSQEKEKREYMRYLDYLSAAGYIENNIEEFDVEPLQGVNGLKVLRIEVAASAPEMEVRTRPDLAAELGGTRESRTGDDALVQ